MKKRRDTIVIGFDFDGVLADYPSIFPRQFINRLYRKNPQSLSHKPPILFMKAIKYYSHAINIRPPIDDVISIIKRAKSMLPDISMIIVSGRFLFLEKLSYTWLKKYNLERYFEGIFINNKDLSPHIHKSTIIALKKVTYFIDDDIVTLQFLAKEHPTVNFFWYNRDHLTYTLPLEPNITPISSLEALYAILQKTNIKLR